MSVHVNIQSGFWWWLWASIYYVYRKNIFYLPFLSTVARPTKYDKVVRREVCQITTQGTRTFSPRDGDVGDSQPSYLMAICEVRVGSLSWYMFFGIVVSLLHQLHTYYDDNISFIFLTFMLMTLDKRWQKVKDFPMFYRLSQQEQLNMVFALLIHLSEHSMWVCSPKCKN